MRCYLATPAAKALQLKDSLFNKSLSNTPALIVVEQSANFDSPLFPMKLWTELASQKPSKRESKLADCSTTIEAGVLGRDLLKRKSFNCSALAAGVAKERRKGDSRFLNAICAKRG